eukprot:scaffold225_cov388-Prasinococcus_capsulatus_cf.AAC.15
MICPPVTAPRLARIVLRPLCRILLPCCRNHTLKTRPLRPPSAAAHRLAVPAVVATRVKRCCKPNNGSR